MKQNEKQTRTLDLESHFISDDVNVVSVDWSKMDNGRMNSILYWKAALNCDLIGGHVADFLNFLDEAFGGRGTLTLLESTHIIGHSLGAHIAGFVGKALEGRLGELVHKCGGQCLKTIFYVAGFVQDFTDYQKMALP